ncbi:MAG: alpha/beta hydrolase [Anaerolineales bacterium]|nr:alpha/beta hydrolase [Anaerolineales bacterium]
MRIKRVILPAVLLLLLVGIYVYLRIMRSFDAVYRRVDAKTAVSLQTFRQTHPPQTVSSDGKLWEYIVFGDGDEAILFLHGMAGAYDIWWQVMSDLAADYRVISVTYPPVDSLAGMAKGITAVLDAEQIGAVHLVGSSLGGYLAQYMVANHSERVKTAVFANTFPPNDIISKQYKTLGGLLPYVPEWLLTIVLIGNAGATLYPAAGRSELVKAYAIEQAYGRMSKAQFLARYYAVIDTFEPPQPTMPVMIIEADNDPLVNETLRQMLKETYPEAVVQTLHKVGHFPYLNEPDLYTQLLFQFIKNLP